MIHFVKYHGTGNDFILIDDRDTNTNYSPEEIRKLCDRHFGIGADGLILLREKTGYAFDMHYYNSDGLPGSMCGNGGRCIVAYAHSLGLTGDEVEFYAFDGPHKARIISSNPYVVSLQMNDVDKIEVTPEFTFLDTGSPHVVKFVESVEDLDVIEEGRKVRHSERFKSKGVNVNFVSVKNGILNVRTYERGVENETLSCGTGVTASVIASAFSGKNILPGCMVITPGGILNVYYENAGNVFRNIWLEGQAEMVFSGEVFSKHYVS